MSEIALRNVCKQFDSEHYGVKDFNLDIHDKEFVIFVGPSGCGKSTTLRIIAGLEEITDGELWIDGELSNYLEPKERGMSMVFQNYALYPNMTVYGNMAYALKIRKMPKDEIDKKVHEVAKILEIEQLLDRKPAALSGGQKQRVAIGSAIIRKPKAFLMDEPLSNLDAKLRVSMREEIRRIQQTLGITTVYVTHDQEEAMALSHRIVVMNKGKFEQVGTPTEVYDNPATKYVASFIGEMNFIEKDGKTIAVRPEDVAITSEPADIQGCVRTIMVLGHYVEVNVQCGDLVVKCFVDRDQSERLTPGDPVNLKFLKTHIF